MCALQKLKRCGDLGAAEVVQIVLTVPLEELGRPQLENGRAEGLGEEWVLAARTAPELAPQDACQQTPQHSTEKWWEARLSSPEQEQAAPVGTDRAGGLANFEAQRRIAPLLARNTLPPQARDDLSHDESAVGLPAAMLFQRLPLVALMPTRFHPWPRRCLNVHAGRQAEEDALRQPWSAGSNRGVEHIGVPHALPHCAQGASEWHGCSWDERANVCGCIDLRAWVWRM